MFDQEHLVAYAAARSAERDPGAAFGDCGRLVVAPHFAEHQFLHSGRGTVNLQAVPGAYLPVLYLDRKSVV